MSALTDLFTAMANKIRSKTGTATTYTPLQMVSDGIDDVYAAGYDAGGGGAAGIPITPSNASPVNLTTGDSYQMLADGYAISSYTNLTPSNASPVSLSSGSIYKMGGAGKAVASVTDVTPSDSTPAALTSGTIYKAGGAGYAIANNPTTLTPSNSSPPSIASGTIYKGGGSGHAISSYAASDNLSNSTITPSTSGAYFYSGWNRMTSSGYAYSSQPPQVKIGTFTASGTTTTKVTTGFQPKYLAVLRITSGTTQDTLNIFDADVTTSYAYIGLSNSGSQRYSIPSTTQYRIASIDSDGFTFNKHSGTATMYYFAIG